MGSRSLSVAIVGVLASACAAPVAPTGEGDASGADSASAGTGTGEDGPTDVPEQPPDPCTGELDGAGLWWAELGEHPAEALSLAVTDDERIVVVGTTGSPAAWSYTADGDFERSIQIDIVGEYRGAVALEDGRVVATGLADGAPTITSLDAALIPEWDKPSVPDGATWGVFDVARVDDVLIRVGWGAMGAESDIYFAAYSQLGTPVWSTLIAEDGLQKAYGIAAAGAGEYVLVGEWNGDSWIRKYDAQDEEVWTTSLDLGTIEWARAVAVDSTGDIVVGGTHWDNGGLRVAWLRKLDATGAEQWGFVVDEDGIDVDSLRGVAVGPDDEIVFVVDHAQLRGSVWKLDAQGELDWTSHGADLEQPDMLPRAVAIDACGDVLITGTHRETGRAFLAKLGG